MSEKTIHIVFQVLNFLSQDISTEYNLTANEQLLLIFLSKHHGAKGIYPSLATLARELHVDYRNVRHTLKRLKDKNLLIIEYFSGRSSSYTLNIPGINLSTTEGENAPGTNLEPRAYTPLPPGRIRPYPQGVYALQSERVNNKNKIVKSSRNKRAQLLTDGFMPSKNTIHLAKGLGYNEEEANTIFMKFMKYYLDKKNLSHNWNKVLQNWLSTERKEMKSNILEEKPWYHKENENMPRGNGMVVLAEIMEKIKSNGHGGQYDGLQQAKTRKAKN